MAEQADKESKTEEPTEKRILDEFEKGNFPVSREAYVFAAMLAMLAIMAFLAKGVLKSVGLSLEHLAANPGGILLQNSADAAALYNSLIYEIGVPFIPVLVILMAVGLASSFLQHAPRIIAARIKPDWTRISLINGWHRIFSVRGQAEFLKSVFKLLSVGIVVWIVSRWQWTALIDSISLDPEAIPEFILMLAVRLLTAVCVATLLLLAVDLVWVRMNWRQDIRMSKQDIKDELKEIEGDPLKKARLRSIALDRRRKSMIAAVPKATLVIANPTHYAIALRYVREEGGAPLVLSKGQDLIALKIREIAEQHFIPIVEDKLLARSMYDAVEVDRPIPPEFYKAVAEIIHILYAKRPGKTSAK